MAHAYLLGIVYLLGWFLTAVLLNAGAEDRHRIGLWSYQKFDPAWAAITCAFQAIAWPLVLLGWAPAVLSRKMIAWSRKREERRYMAAKEAAMEAAKIDALLASEGLLGPGQ